MGNYHPKNKMNHLDGTSWVKFTKSWFILKSRPRKADQVQHPAKYPEELAASFIEFFTRRGDMVLDPFAGVGSTLLAAAQLGRHSVGLELNPAFVELAKQHLVIPDPELAHWMPHILQADARQVYQLFQDHGFVRPDFVMTSPPYGNMLKTTRGFDERATAKQRAKQGLKNDYSDDPQDLGNLEYHGFLDVLIHILAQCAALLRNGGHMVLVVQNYRRPDGGMDTLAFDLVRRLEGHDYLRFVGEKIWCQDDKYLGIWGYPSTLVVNMHHHYALIFKKDEGRLALLDGNHHYAELRGREMEEWMVERDPGRLLARPERAPFGDVAF